jgi:hypothetical protein
VTHPGFPACPALDTPDRSTTDHPVVKSTLIDGSVDDPAPVTPSPHYSAGSLLIIPRRNPKIQPCTSEPCRMVGQGTLSPLPLKGLPVGYGGGSGVWLPCCCGTPVLKRIKDTCNLDTCPKITYMPPGVTRRLVEHPGERLVKKTNPGTVSLLAAAACVNRWRCWSLP